MVQVEAKEGWFTELLGLENGIPSHDTFGDVFALIDTEEFSECFSKHCFRLLLPEELAHHRANTLRWRLYAIAVKVVRTGRHIFIRMKEKHQVLLQAVLAIIRVIEPVAI